MSTNATALTSARKYQSSAWVYQKSEPGLWTVGFYKPDGKWEPESDHNSEQLAARRVHYLNGGNEDADLRAHIIAMENDAYLSGHPEWEEIVKQAKRAA